VEEKFSKQERRGSKEKKEKNSKGILNLQIKH
jgi:hypothetical protein